MILANCKVINVHMYIEVYSYLKVDCSLYIRAGVCRPCVETELTATKKSATDGN